MVVLWDAWPKTTPCYGPPGGQGGWHTEEGVLDISGVFRLYKPTRGRDDKARRIVKYCSDVIGLFLHETFSVFVGLMSLVSLSIFKFCQQVHAVCTGDINIPFHF